MCCVAQAFSERERFHLPPPTRVSSIAEVNSSHLSATFVEGFTCLFSPDCVLIFGSLSHMLDLSVTLKDIVCHHMQAKSANMCLQHG